VKILIVKTAKISSPNSYLNTHRRL